jgi:tRNA pseudouridine13 synthase
MNKIYAYNHQPIPFDFAQSIERFFVEEIPLYQFSNSGNFLILKIKKQDISTFKLLSVIANSAKIEQREVGYAGLKDKNATTIQYISLPKKYEKELLKNLKTEKIEILEKFYSKFPIKIGQLKANRFSIVLHRVCAKSFDAIKKVTKVMLKEGIPNYFGYQRFGEDGKSYLQGQKIAQSGKRLKGAKERLLVSAYQSYLFNEWLANRIKISQSICDNSIHKAMQKLNYPKALVEALDKQHHFFKLFIGEHFQTYPYGKEQRPKSIEQCVTDFARAKLSPTGLLAGSHVKRANSDARVLEEPYDDRDLASLKGDRRFAWIWVKDLSLEYNEKSNHLTINFTLPKGSYATTFLEEIGKRELKPT